METIKQLEEQKIEIDKQIAILKAKELEVNTSKVYDLVEIK